MKNFFLTDREIQDLVDEPKTLSRPAASVLRGMTPKQGRSAAYLQNSLKFPRNNGDGEWLIYLRRNRENPLDFSCGLGYIPKGRNRVFTLRRCNGKSHWHTNRLEKESPFYDFHIHRATERYQQSSYSAEHYARTTDRYTDLIGAFRHLLMDCTVTDANSDDRQTRLFE